MEKNTHKTKVKFYREPNEGENTHFYPDILAVFIEEKFNEKLYGKNVLTCYSHLGQHSSVSLKFLELCEICNDSEAYKHLVSELEDQGYNLEIIN